MSSRRFLPSWSIDELEACFVVIDSAGQKPAYLYFEDEPGRRSAAKLLSKNEARRIATNYCRACSATCWPTCTLTHTYKLWRTGERAVGNMSEEPKINVAWYLLGRTAPKNAECVAL